MMMQRMLSVALLSVGLHQAAAWSSSGASFCTVDKDMMTEDVGAQLFPERSRNWRLLTPVMGSIHPGQDVPFSIVNDEMKRNSEYKGFLIHAKDGEGNKIGEFKMGSGFKACGSRANPNTITHSSSADKDGTFQFHWMAPNDEFDEVHFELIVVASTRNNDWHMVERAFRIVDDDTLPTPGTCRANDRSFDIGYGDCDTYAVGESNHEHCELDRATVPCCLACGRDTGRCSDDRSFFGPYGGCDTYETGEINHQHCALDRVQNTCCSACGTGTGTCEDDTTFVGQYGRCATYYPGQVNHQHCALDQVEDTCCEACSGGQACQDDSTFMSPYGACSTYEIGQPNHVHCETDGVVDECCAACQGHSTCNDDMNFRGPYGNCESYKAGNVNHVHCETDGVLDNCCAACNSGTAPNPTQGPGPSCQDSQTFMGQHGVCSTYAQGNPNHAFCGSDGVTQTCCQSCSNSPNNNNQQQQQQPQQQQQLQDDTNWSGEHGNCLSYAKGTPNHAHCALDNVMQICAFSCQN